MAWLTNWNKRKKLNINGTTAGAQTVYQMKVTVYFGTGTDSAGKVYCGGYVKGDFSDVVFTDTDGITPLNYWKESFVTGTSAIIWVKIPNIPTGSNSTSIYIYYNNPLATSSSNGLSTFDFFDDFIGTSLDSVKWNIVTISGNAGNSILVSNSNLTITADLNDGYGICAKTTFTGNQAFEARGYYVLTKPKSGSYFAPVTLLLDNTHHIYDSPTGNGYYSEWQESGSNNGRLKRFLSPSTRTILTQTTITMTAGTLYNQSLILDSGHVTWQINGANVVQSTDTNYRTGLYAGIQSNTGCKIQVDSAFIRKYVNPEPTFGTVAAEEFGASPTGNLNVRSNPINAKIYIDSIDQGSFSPITIYGLPLGTHTVLVSKSPYPDYTAQVDIAQNQTAYLSAPIAIGIVNGSFDTDLSNWTNTIGTGTYSSGYDTFRESSGKAHVRSGSTYGASGEVFVTFWQRFYLDKHLLVFDAQALIVDDSYGYACGDILGPSPSGCGWTVTDDSNNVIAYGKPGTTLTTISIDLTNYVNQWLTIIFRVGAARCCGYYYEILLDNVMTAYGSTLRVICPDTGQFCNASLYIDNVYTGTTPFKTYLNLGTHNFTLFKNGYDRFDGSINITSTEITAENTTGMNIDSTLVVGPGGVINGTFDIDLNGWTISGSATWDNGRVHLTNGGKISQIFAVSDNLLQFDYETLGHVTQDSGFGYQLYIDDVLKIDKRFFVYGTESVYIGNYIGRTAKILFYEVYGWEGWIDNVRVSHTTGIFNGDFESGLIGWESSGEVSISNCGDWPARWGPPCSGSCAIVGLNDGGSIYQIFILDKCALKFDWKTGYSGAYQIYSGDILITSGTLPDYSGGTQTVQLPDYVGSTLKIVLFSSGPYGGSLYVDNVMTITNLYDVSVVSYPSGAEIYIDNVDTGHATADSPVTVDGGSEGTHTVTLKLAGYPDYVETINIIRCAITYVSATFGGCVTFITDPPGAKICIDNTDTDEVTPKTFCGYLENHTYSLFLKNYRVETDTITFPSDKGLLINKTLTYETGSVRFNIDPSGSKIIIDGTDTGKLTPDVVDNLLIGYHSYEIGKDDYYSLTGSFRIIVDTEKQITESLQQVTGIDNGTFDTNIDGWNLSSSNLAQGYAEWLNGQAHLITNGIPITFSKDFVVTEDSLVFYYYPPVSLNANCNIGWNVIANPDTPQQTTLASYCGYGRSSEHWGYFEVDLSQYIGSTIRLNLNLTGNKIFYIGGPAEAYLDNVGNVPKLTRSITFDNYCIKKGCYVNPIVDRCSADIYLDNNFIGTIPIQANSLVLGNHSYVEKNKGYISLDTGTEDTTGTLSFSQGVPTHFYIDGLYSPSPLPPIPPGEGCLYIESNPPGAEIFLDGNDTGKITPNTICNISLTNHDFELKFLNHTVYRGSFTLYPDFGEYLSVNITGSIYFTSTPSGAEIFLDGNDLGIKTPSIVNNILAGNHEYTLKLQYYLDYTGTIYVVGEPK